MAGEDEGEKMTVGKLKALLEGLDDESPIAIFDTSNDSIHDTFFDDECPAGGYNDGSGKEFIFLTKGEEIDRM